MLPALTRMEDWSLTPCATYDLKENSGTSAIHIIDLQARQQRELIGNLKSAARIQFVQRPEGSRLFFVGVRTEDKDAKPQLWSIDPSGGEPQQVTNVESGVANVKVSPTGKYVAFTAEVKMDQEVKEIYEDLPKADARIIDSLMYRHWNAWHDFSFSHLHVVALNDEGGAGEAVDLMKGIRARLPLAAVRRRRAVQLVARRHGDRLSPPRWSTTRRNRPTATSIWSRWTGRAPHAASRMG